MSQEVWSYYGSLRDSDLGSERSVSQTFKEVGSWDCPLIASHLWGSVENWGYSKQPWAVQMFTKKMEMGHLTLVCLFSFPLLQLEILGQMIHSDDFWVSQNRKKNSVLGVHTEKAVAPHSSTLAWKIPWTEEPGGLQSMGSRRVGHDRVTSLSLFTFMHWRRKWQPTPVFLPGESQGRGSLVGCHLWDLTESDTTEAT